MLFDNYIIKVELQFFKNRAIIFLVKLQSVYARMTWLGEAMKDAVSSDMLRVAANRL